MGRLLLQGATVVTMAPDVADGAMDVLVDGARIMAVAPDLDGGDAERVDLTGRIVIPGLVNAHMHTWQTALRGLAADWTLLEYFRHVHAGLATHFTPQDIHVGTLAGALNQIDCGTTTLGDWCHNNPTPAHTDAAVDALVASGIRAAFLHGSPKPEPLPGQPHFSEVPHPRGEVERLRRGRFFASDGLLTLGMAILGPHYSTIEVALADFRLAAELALVASMHQGGGPPKSPGGWDAVEAAGLVGPSTNIVHGNDLPDDRLRRFVDAGATFTATPEAEMAMGHGHPITGRLRALGTAPSLGVDIESAASGEMLTVARIALAHQRALDHASIRARTGGIAERPSIAAREALSWITNRGAEALGQADRVGSLAPGKQADLVVIDARALSLAPVHDPVATVLQAGRADIEAVMVAGEWRKRGFRLLHPGLDAIRLALVGSGERIVAALAR